MLFDDAQSYTAFKSSCRISQSATFPTPEYSLVSSEKLTSLDADTSLSISEIIIKNRSEPKTVTCGTPLNTGWSSLISPDNCTKWDLSVRKWNNQIPIFPVIPNALSLCKRMPWSTLSNAFEKSRYTMSTDEVLSNMCILLSKTSNSADRQERPGLNVEYCSENPFGQGRKILVS